MDEKAIERLLISDWASGLRITTVPQAMNRLGFADDLETRWGMANRMGVLWHSMLETPEKVREVNSAIGLGTDEERSALSQHWRDQVATWDRASILLTDDEKLLARQILWCQRSGLRLPSPEDIGAALEIGPEETANGVRILTWLGFLALHDGQPLKNYTLAEDHERFLDGLGFSFHTVTLDDGERFGIPWAIDFLLLVNSQYREHRIKLEDACAHCAERIFIEADQGKLIRVLPKEAVVHRGGTWGQNNLFRSEEHLLEWNGGEYPEPGTWMPAAGILEEIRARNA